MILYTSLYSLCGDGRIIDIFYFYNSKDIKIDWLIDWNMTEVVTYRRIFRTMTRAPARALCDHSECDKIELLVFIFNQYFYIQYLTIIALDWL